MKKIMLIICLLGFFNCEYVDTWTNISVDPETMIEIGEITDYDFENDIEINSVDELLHYMKINSHYQKDNEDYWQLPEETYDRGIIGDCEDFSIFNMYILKEKLNIASKLAVIEQNGLFHAIVILNENNYIDRSTIRTNLKDKEIIFTISYEKIIWMIMYFHKPIGEYIF